MCSHPPGAWAGDCEAREGRTGVVALRFQHAAPQYNSKIAFAQWVLQGYGAERARFALRGYILLSAHRFKLEYDEAFPSSQQGF